MDWNRSTLVPGNWSGSWTESFFVIVVTVSIRAFQCTAYLTLPLSARMTSAVTPELAERLGFFLVARGSGIPMGWKAAGRFSDWEVVKGRLSGSPDATLHSTVRLEAASVALADNLTAPTDISWTIPQGENARSR